MSWPSLPDIIPPYIDRWRSLAVQALPQLRTLQMPPSTRVEGNGFRQAQPMLSRSYGSTSITLRDLERAASLSPSQSASFVRLSITACKFSR